ncbi:MAG: hypothetical protein IJG42_06035 [Muribaculaceae bacterium]|nr:hypothetical protein [Muribaculaceae bacterium]
MERKSLFLIMGLLLLVATLASLSSCSSSDDEPVPTTFSYYLAIESSELLGLSEDELNGSNLPPSRHNVYVTIIKMRRALRKEFPKPRLQGNDARVIAICDSCYRESIYCGAHGATLCTLRLIRTQNHGERVVKSQQLKFYKFIAI